MKITDINVLDLPLRIKLNSNFTLDESFDVGTILQINAFELDGDWQDDGDKCYKVYVTALHQDLEHNKSISKSDWFNKETKNYDCDYFDCVYNQKEKQDNGDFKSIIYVMEDDDCFDLITSNNDKFKYSIEILNEIKKELINSLGIANNGSD